MKVLRKNVHIRDDCFHAEERGVRVWIRSHRSVVIVDAFASDGTNTQVEISLSDLAQLLIRGGS